MSPSNIRNLTNVEFLDLVASDRFWTPDCSAEILDAIKERADKLARDLERHSSKLLELSEMTDNLSEDLVRNNK